MRGKLFRKKLDSFLVKKGERFGQEVSMIGLKPKVQNGDSKQIQSRFKREMTKYDGLWEGDSALRVVRMLNSYLTKRDEEFILLEFPEMETMEIRIVPVASTIRLKVVLANGGFGMGKAEPSVSIKSFFITDQTTLGEVDEIVDFIRNLEEKTRNRG